MNLKNNSFIVFDKHKIPFHQSPLEAAPESSFSQLFFGVN